MSEQFRIETEEIGKEVKKLVSTLFEGRFRSQRNTQINDYEWESLVNDQDLGKQFTMVIKRSQLSSIQAFAGSFLI
ncbi:hypothetical protein P9443_07900 [Peribacillus frigoritolerans]|uniref:hypothetical protein n=1 Tax=Peribacillus frigoritolerans TaxID=450367 RepID=UPI002E2486E3|nr:hypothetical protein [Peribacillus frigoritolerans]